MGFWQTFLSWFDKGSKTVSLDTFISDLATEIYFKELAVQACVNLISNTVARSEFRTYENGKETRKDNYYLLNVEPSPNRNSSKFWREVVSHLVYDNESLIIQQDGYFYVADSFQKKKYAFKEHIYSDITIDNYQLRNTYIESQVLYFELHNERIKDVVDGLYRSYSKLISASQSHYKKSSTRRGTLEIPTNYPKTEESERDLENLLKDKFKRFFEAEGGAVLPLTGGLKYSELSNAPGTSKGSVEGRDIRSFIDDIFDFVAIAFQVPPQLLRGNVADTDKAMNNFLTFCINPLAELITDEINRKMYGKSNYLKRTYVKLDTSNIRAVDIKDVANALDVLIRCGAYSIDDCLMAMGMEPLNTEWSRARWMTRNYEPIEVAFEGGGEA